MGSWTLHRFGNTYYDGNFFNFLLNPNMKQRGILFKPEMILAILENRKTMTRRIIKPRIGDGRFDVVRNGHGELCDIQALDENDNHVGTVYCPYGEVGDVLYVKEGFEIFGWDKETRNVTFTYSDQVYNEAILTEDEWRKFNCWKNRSGSKSPLFMFKSLARIFLEITDIKVERVSEISEEDAKAEGVEKLAPFVSYTTYFEQLWNKINGEETWNSWVWVISFKQIQKPYNQNSK